jgi:hypothetical protein
MAFDDFQSNHALYQWEMLVEFVLLCQKQHSWEEFHHLRKAKQANHAKDHLICKDISRAAVLINKKCLTKQHFDILMNK